MLRDREVKFRTLDDIDNDTTLLINWSLHVVNALATQYVYKMLRHVPKYKEIGKNSWGYQLSQKKKPRITEVRVV